MEAAAAEVVPPAPEVLVAVVLEAITTQELMALQIEVEAGAVLTMKALVAQVDQAS